MHKLIGTEIRLLFREPVALFFAVAFPSILVGILGSIPAFREPTEDLGGGRVIDLYVPIAVALVLAMTALQFTPAVLATYRERGVLRRLSVTPVHPGRLLAAQVVTSLLTVVVSAFLVFTVGRLAFGVPLPRNRVGFLFALVLAAAGLFGIGLLIAALVPTGKAANAAGTILFFPTMFFAGLWTPREVMPETLRRIGDYTPLGAGEHALHDAAVGSWPQYGQVAVLVAYIVVFGVAAARLFRWE
jgi:ABC-2 type transport system permease protein